MSVDYEITTPCLEWQGTKIDGYGATRINGKVMLVHRRVIELMEGSIPDGLVVMHLCDNRACFRYDHLRVGTVADNNKDMRDKGRGKPLATHCPNGHEYSEENTQRDGQGYRLCRICRKETRRKSRQRTYKGKYSRWFN